MFPYIALFITLSPIELVKSPGQGQLLQATTNGNVESSVNNNAEPESGGLLALICGSLCKDTPLAEMFSQSTNANTNAPAQNHVVQNGEIWFVELSDSGNRRRESIVWFSGGRRGG